MSVSLMTVVWLPEWNAATYTVVPSVASARGVSAKKVRTSTGVPPSATPRLVASNTQTSARSMPAVVRRGSAGLPPPKTPAIELSVRCWPRWAVVMKARLVAHEQGTRHDRRGTREIDDADAVREVVHHPDFVVAARRDCDGLHADRHGRRKGQSARPDVEDLERVVRRVDRE
jgi:hypothetical protein